tara:strand:- start:187 stop:441 length:255 start_codon:yes stop_codon:yes gene_type:complete
MKNGVVTDYFSVDTEYDAAFGPWEDDYYTPENIREMPCDRPCPHRNFCTQNSTQCSAFREWAVLGNYIDEEVGKYIRPFKFYKG